MLHHTKMAGLVFFWFPLFQNSKGNKEICPTRSRCAAVLLRCGVWLISMGTKSSQIRLWMFGECFRPGVQKKRDCHRRCRQEAPESKQMLWGRSGCRRRKSKSQRSNYGGLKITRLERSVLSQCLCSTHSIPHNKLIRLAQPPWFRMEELMQQHLVSQSYPSCLLQPATLGVMHYLP